jgi:hypothetical protein
MYQINVLLNEPKKLYFAYIQHRSSNYKDHNLQKIILAIKSQSVEFSYKS